MGAFVAVLPANLMASAVSCYKIITCILIKIDSKGGISSLRMDNIFQLSHESFSLLKVFGTKKTLWFFPMFSEDDLDNIPALHGIDFPTRSDVEA